MFCSWAKRPWHQCGRPPARFRSFSQESMILSELDTLRAWHTRAETLPASPVRNIGFSAKLLQLLKQIAPTVSRAAVIRDPLGPGGLGQLGALQGAAFILGMELTPVDPTNVGEMERAIMDFAGRPNGGVVVPASAVAGYYRRDVIIALATQHRLPAVYSLRGFVAEGGLISYGIDLSDLFRRAAGYVDRILRGEKPSDLPVQVATKFETVINLKTAKSLGLTVPPNLLATADEVIE